MDIFSCQNVLLKSNGYQLTLADIGPKSANLAKIKQMRHVFHSVLGFELEFEGKNKIFPKTSNTSKISSNPKSLTKMNIFCEIVIFAFKFKLRA